MKRFNNINCLAITLVVIFMSMITTVSAEAASYLMENFREEFREDLLNLGISQECFDYGVSIAGVNNAGDILVQAWGGPCGSPGDLYLYSNGQWEDISPGFYFYDPRLNNLGQVIIQYWGNIYLYDGAQFSTVITNDMLYAGDGIAAANNELAFNNYGQIVFIGVNNSGPMPKYNVYLYDNGTVTKITYTGYYYVYSDLRVNDSGTVFYTRMYQLGSCTERDVFAYDGNVVNNLTNLPCRERAAISGVNSNDLMYVVSNLDTGCKGTFLYDGLLHQEILHDSMSICYSGAINGNSTMLFINGDETQLFLTNGTAWEEITTDFPAGTTYTAINYPLYLYDNEDILVGVDSPPDSIFPSKEYFGTARPFAINALSVSGITENEAIVTWDTEVPASAQVQYGANYSLGSWSDLFPDLTTSHQVVLALEPYTTYYFRAVSVDGLDNESLSTIGSFSTPDLTPPTTSPELTGTTGLNGWYVSDVTLTLTALDAASGVKEIRRSINSSPFYAYPGSSTTTTLGDGMWSVSYYAVDNVGNIEDTNTVEFNVDKTIPGQPINISPADREKGIPFNPTVLSASAYADSNGQLDSQWQVCDEELCASPVYDSSGGVSITHNVYGLNSKTSYYWRVRYQDVAGNWSDWSAATEFTTAK